MRRALCAVAWLLVAASASAAITRVQQKTASLSSAATSISVTMDAGATANNVLVVAVIVDKGSGAFTLPTGFTRIGTDVDSTSASVTGSWCYLVAAGGETSVTYAWANSSHLASVWIGEYSPVTASPKDVDAGADSGSSNVTSQTSGTTGTTAQASEIAIAMFGCDTGTNCDGGRAWSNSFTEDTWVDALVSGSPALGIAEKTLTSTGTVETTFSTTDTPGDQSMAKVVTFKDSTAATGWGPLLDSGRDRLVNPGWR